MTRSHGHADVADLGQSVRYYTTLLGIEPTVRKDDYAKWMLEDPGVNFAISACGRLPGVDHSGIQGEEPAALAEITARLHASEVATHEETDAHCCYARSDKTWSTVPSGIRWESFHTHGDITTDGLDTAPDQHRQSGGCNTSPIKAASGCNG